MDFYATLNQALGTHVAPNELTFLQVSCRGVVVFISALVMLRIGDKRFLGKKTAFDVILGFTLASMLARAVNGSAAFFPSLGCGFVLVLLHRLFATIAFHWHSFGVLIKGNDDLVIKDGKIIHEALRKNSITERDLLEDLRLNGHMSDPAAVKEARMERSGDISVVK